MHGWFMCNVFLFGLRIYAFQEESIHTVGEFKGVLVGVHNMFLRSSNVRNGFLGWNVVLHKEPSGGTCVGGLLGGYEFHLFHHEELDAPSYGLDGNHCLCHG